MAHFPSADFGAVFDFGQQLRVNPDTTMGDLLGVGCVLRTNGSSFLRKALADTSSKPWSTLPA
jgi:hypothetical protein